MEKKNQDGLTEKEFLQQYKPGDYERPSVTVDMLIYGMDMNLTNLKLLLIQRNNHPYMDCWSLPGGFVGMKESAYEAAERELKEETGLTNIYMEQLYTMSRPDRDPRMRVISIAYMALIPVAEAHAGDDAKDAAWFDVSLSGNQMLLTNREKNIRMEYQIEEKEFKNGRMYVKGHKPVLKEGNADFLAFDHAEIILEGLFRLRNKVEYTDIAFNLLPEEFTLPDLQKVYEILSGKVMYKTNFRGKMVGKIVPLNREGKSITGGRKSELYQYRSMV